MKKLLLLTLLILSVKADDCPICLPTNNIDWTNEPASPACLTNNVTFFFNVNSNSVKNTWSNFGRVDILYTTNLSDSVTNWSCLTNIQMSEHGIYNNSFPTDVCFFRLRLVNWTNQ